MHYNAVDTRVNGDCKRAFTFKIDIPWSFMKTIHPEMQYINA